MSHKEFIHRRDPARIRHAGNLFVLGFLTGVAIVTIAFSLCVFFTR